MADRKKVINAIEQAKKQSEEYAQDKIIVPFKEADMIIALLKELEPIAPSVCGSKEPDGHGSWWYLCGKCKKPIDHKDRFCKRCGQAVKWDDDY